MAQNPALHGSDGLETSTDNVDIVLDFDGGSAGTKRFRLWDVDSLGGGTQLFEVNFSVGAGTVELIVGFTGGGIIKAGVGQPLAFERQDGFAWVTLPSGATNAVVTLDTVLKDGVEWNWGNANDSGILWSTVQTNDGMILWTKVNAAAESGNIIITADTNRTLDHGYAISPNPRLYIARTSSPTTNWISFHHDGDGNIITGVGDLNLAPAGIVVANALAVSDLTVGRIPFVGTAGRLVDSANLLFDGNGVVTLSSGTAPIVVHFVLNTTDAAGRSALHFLQVAGSLSADPSTIYQVSGAKSWATGLDNSDSDAFKVSESTALGVNDRLVIAAGGAVTMSTSALVGSAGTPTSLLESAGSFAAEIDTVAVDTTLTDQHHTVKVDASGGARIMTLPTAASSARRIYRIKKIDSSPNAVTVDGNGAELIDGAATQVITAQWDSIDVQSDGTVWSIH